MSLSRRGGRRLSEDDGDHRHAVTGARSHQAESGFSGVPGLDAGDIGHLPDQRVVVLQRAVVGVARPRDGRLGRAHHGAERLVLHRVSAEDGHVPRRRVVVCTIESMRIGEVGVLHAEFGRFCVHLRHEGLFRARRGLGKSHRGIVAALDQEAVEHILDRKLLARHQPYLRFSRLGRMLRGCDYSIQRQTLESQDPGHDLRRGGDRPPRVGFLLVQHSAVVHVDEDGRGPADRGRTGRQRGVDVVLVTGGSRGGGGEADRLAGERREPEHHQTEGKKQRRGCASRRSRNHEPQYTMGCDRPLTRRRAMTSIPVGGSGLFPGRPAPDVILATDQPRRPRR